MIFKAKNGASIIERIEVDESEALCQYPAIDHALIIVKMEDDYLLGWHKWRDDYETFGGLMDRGENLRECINRECEEELGIKDMDDEYLGVLHTYMPPGYWVKEWHEEYGGIYGITLPKTMLSVIEQNRLDREEIGEIAFYSELKRRGEKIDEINEALLAFYP